MAPGALDVWRRRGPFPGTYVPDQHGVDRTTKELYLEATTHMVLGHKMVVICRFTARTVANFLEWVERHDLHPKWRPFDCIEAVVSPSRYLITARGLPEYESGGWTRPPRWSPASPGFDPRTLAAAISKYKNPVWRGPY